MSEREQSYRLYTFFKWAGNFATGLMLFLVLKVSNYDWSIFCWMLPLLMLIEFGCFAERDRSHKYGKPRGSYE